MSFETLGLSPELLRALAERSYTEPTPIQLKAIPAVLSGRDLLAGAQTGTGKTAAFVLPLLDLLKAHPGGSPGREPRVLVLVPTRELAAQVAESARNYGAHTAIRVSVVFGGVSINPQLSDLRRGCDVLVATPGRLLDLHEQGAARFTAIRHLVLDEADRMLDMGFIRDIRRILKLLPARRQNLLFSATYDDRIRELARSMLANPVTVEVAPRNATAELVEQAIYRVPKEHKRHLLAHLITANNWHQVLIFTRTKHGANRLMEQLEGSGIQAAAIHGNRSQNARQRALADFKAGKVTALVATEVAARGIDIRELPQVVNYELPDVPEDYVHRIGRTARAGAQGHAVSLVSPDETTQLRDIERLLKRSLPVLANPDFPVPPPGSQPVQHRPPQSASAGRGRPPQRGAPVHASRDNRAPRDSRAAGKRPGGGPRRGSGSPGRWHAEPRRR